jgi:survival-of-motor-neuron-related-splicing factor 30
VRHDRKEQIADQREYKKKKAQKKVLRMKELEQEREDQKSKWQSFNNKAYNKNKKGQVYSFIRIFLYFTH